ncbi:TonB-linked outer membrane protein, SusC/RagA family [Algoriphagus ornithinivorans]|uniref:TonB-linked outer membrane protein, SusC/RagA family n=1 Tax=Algoriphagus ornithinivorans TaxID=226506 RepID=A0A1I5GD10_9BACT|nr:SusC/RagA family TonB-linked outer membrane protein [Algoriphagus ornithinivorans]SFO33968.1 TonB-linked outer membrane protein, SusC/RagA family [Algoriphagus ornithinivorans]
MKKVLLGILLGVMTVMSALAQSKTITGKVTSSEEPQGVPGASIVVKGTTVGAITDIDGTYSINVPENATTLVFSFVGYLTKEVNIQNRSVIDVQLETDVKVLNEVVVVGYGTQERREVTGSVSSISNESIANLVAPSFDSQLAGRAPGVQVTTPNGILGARPIIRIRGVNSLTSSADPLIVIDGVPIVDDDRSAVNASNPLANINPADIQSYEVLKDGSATAIYGSRAANGVILITTKRGSDGKAKVSYNTSMGFNEEVERFQLLNGDQFVTIANEKRSNAGQSPLANPGVNTDWQDLIYRKGFTQQHNISISGGSAATKYFFSLGFTDQESAIRPNDLKRYSFRANIDHSISDAIRIGTSLSYSLTEIFGLNNGANSLSGAIYNSTRALPNVPIYDPENIAFDGYNVTANGATTGFGANLAGPDNNIPNIGFVIDNNLYRSRAHRILGSVYGEADLATGLTARTQIGTDLTLADDFQSLDPRHGDGRSSNGYVYMAYNPAIRWNWQNTLNYQTVIGENHNINVTGGVEYQFTRLYNFAGWGTDISDNFYREQNLISGSYNNQFSGGGYSEQGFDSYFGRFNYNYGGRYLLSLTVRNDGISDLIGDNKRGTFFGGSVGWRVSDEAFFNSNLISDLKVRGSYAEVGNVGLASFAAFGGFSPVLGGAGAGIGYARVANGGLQWETSKKFNVGFDMTIGPVSLTADYFINNIDGLILAAPTPPSLGVPGNSINQNVGAMRNSGLELRALATVLSRGKFTWNTDFNITFLNNEVTNLIQPLTGTYNRTEVGGPVAQLYGFKWAGVNPANGNPLYHRGEEIVQYNLQRGAIGWRTYDPANPGNVSTTASGPTQEFLGNTLPKWQGGWSNTFKYGNFDAEIFTRFSGGNFIMNESLRGLLGQGFSNNHASIMNRWTESGQVTDMPKLYSGQDANMWQTSASNSRFVEKGDFVRIQNIVLGYTLPSNVLQSAFAGKITNARVFAQVQNPFIFTNYTGLDPESNTFSGQQSFGVDWNVAPIIRTYTLGVNVGF